MFVFDVYQTERQNSRSGVSIEIEQQRPTSDVRHVGAQFKQP